MENSKWFIFSFLATLLIISSLPLSLYLTATDAPETTDPTELDVALNKFISYEELQTFLTTSTGGSYTVDARVATLESNDAWTFSGAPESTPGPVPSAPVEPSESKPQEPEAWSITLSGDDSSSSLFSIGFMVVPSFLVALGAFVYLKKRIV